MAPEPEFDVYLSYSRSDVGVVEELDAQLSAAGFSVVRDATALNVGDDWQATSTKALATARFVAFWVGRAGLTEGQLRELSAAEAQAQIARDFLFAAVLLP